MDFNRSFSAQVRIEMIPRGFRQNDLAVASKLSAKALSNRLTGETEWDGLSMASVAGGLGMKLSDLVARAEALADQMTARGSSAVDTELERVS